MARLALAGGTPARTAPFAPWPDFDDRERSLLLEALEARSWGGYPFPNAFADRFAAAFAAAHDVRHAFAVANGTIEIEGALEAMMGGLLTWLFVIQAMLIGVLFLGINYYMWQGMARLKGAERYQPYYQFVLGGLTLALFIWLTPHTLMMSGSEVKAMGGAQHPVIGNYGVMSAKNGAINAILLFTALSFLYYRRASRTMTVSWVRTGNIAIAVLFAIGMLNVIGLSVYGYYLPAKIRVGLSAPQAFTTFTVIAVSLIINSIMLMRAVVHGPVQWGKIPFRGMVVLFGLSAAFTWVMGLMSFIRSSGRLS